MNLDFSVEQEMLRKSVNEFLSKECPYEVVKEIEESDEGYDNKLWKKMVQLGWMESCFPEEYGGCGDSFLDLVILMEEMGKAALPSPFFSTVALCGQTILVGGNEKQKKELLQKIMQGKLIAAMAHLEESAGFSEAEIHLTAEPSGNNFILNGKKLFVQDANIAHKLITIALVPPKGLTLFMVDSKNPGLFVAKMPTIGMDNQCEVVFKNAEVSQSDMIGQQGKGWGILKQVFRKATIAKCAEMVGGCRAALDMTKKYAKQREQYGKPIGAFQVIQHYMANMLMGYDTTYNYLYKVAWMSDHALDVAREVHALKAQCNNQYKYITERAVQIHGAVGTTREFNVALFYRRAKAAEYILGDSEYHYEKLAEALFCEKTNLT
jgi:alkylation response protein AidB-like acyl-CoA dehydrogenase